jgi:hypothetical protein
MSTVRVNQNIWGNYLCYVGSERRESYGQEHDAKVWLAARVLEGHTVSAKSDFSAESVEKYKEFVNVEKPWGTFGGKTTIDLRPLKAYDVWRNHDGNYKAELAKQAIVDDRDAPYGFHIHEIRVLARDGNDAIRRAKKEAA